MLRRLGSCGHGIGSIRASSFGGVGYVDRARFVVYCLKLERFLPIGLSRLLLLLANDDACLHCLTTPDLGCGWGLAVPIWGLRGLTSHLFLLLPQLLCRPVGIACPI